MAMILLTNVDDIHIRIIPQSISKWLCPKIPDAPIGKMLVFCVPIIYTLPVNYWELVFLFFSDTNNEVVWKQGTSKSKVLSSQFYG